MAQGSATFLLTKLSEHLGGEEELLRGVHDDAELMKNELKLMNAFLRVADSRQDETLKVMVKQIRRVAYEIEDALDDFSLHLVRDPHPADRTFAALTKLVFYVKTLGAQHRIAYQLRSIKKRVQTLGEQQRRHFNQINELIRPGPPLNNVRPARRTVAVLDADPVGVEGHKNKLIVQLLGDGAARYVVSVVGMGGLGKSTLARMVYNDAEIKKQFTVRAWITVSQSYEIEDLLKKVIQKLHQVQPQALEDIDHETLRGEIGNLLRNRRYLIVLDDVWDTNIWDEFREVLPNDSFRSRVLFTTRNEAVAFHSCQGAHENIYKLTPLSAEDSQTLFKRQLFPNGPYSTNLQNVINKFLHRCEGLPLAIMAIAGVLSTRDIGRLNEWEMIYNSLGDELQDNDQLESLKDILSLSYNDLPYYLKSCLLYLSIFPLGNTIERRRVIRLWVAEGFVKKREGMTLEEVADSYFDQLIKRSLVKAVEMTDDGRVKTCHIHDILRVIMVSKAKDQVFAAIVKDQDNMWPEMVRRLSIHGASASNQQRQIGSHSRLRSLLMFWGLDHSPASPTLKLPLQRLRFLNVLHLEGAPLTEFPRHVINLFLLKYLSLRDTKVASIPSSIDKLQNLETLDMKHTLVTKLPLQILKLQKLRHLLVYRFVYDTENQAHKYGFKSPIHIGKLECIQALCFIEADQGEELLVEIGKLNQLRRLGIVKLRSGDGKFLCSSICKLMNLRSLSVTAVSEDEIISMDNLFFPPRFLQRLYLTGRLERMPDWISSLHTLMKLVLKWSKLSVADDPLAPLQDLPNLVHLAFVQVYEGDVLLFRKNGFQKLKFLGLNRLDRLNNIVLEEGAVASLEKLVVHSCNSLHNLPEQLAKLKELEFFDMPKEFAESLRDKKTIDRADKYDFKP